MQTWLQSTSAPSATTSAAASSWIASKAPALTIIDRSTGERTVFWRRDECLKVHPEDMISAAHPMPALALE
jgi:hypothetical protein